MNESPGYAPQWVSHHGEVPPEHTQAQLAAIRPLLANKGIDPWMFTAEMMRAQAEINSLARLDLEADEIRRRIANDNGKRHDLDDVIEALGLTREELERS